MKQRIIIFGAVVFTAALVLLICQEPPKGPVQTVIKDSKITEGETGSPLQTVSQQQVPSIKDKIQLEKEETFSKGLPYSLEGTDIDGYLSIDFEGNLIVTRGVREIFDYFLSATGEEPVETAISRIRSYIIGILDEPAASQALKILDSYIEYEYHLYELEKENPAPELEMASDTIDTHELSSILKHRMEIRRRYLGEDVAKAFFGEEEMYDRITLSRLDIIQDHNLTEDEKVAEIDNLDTQFPEEIIQYRKKEERRLEVANMVQSMQEQGASEDAIFNLRTEAFGEEAAERFRQLDNRRAEWRTRVESYKKGINDIMSSQGLTDEEKNVKVGNLRRESFTKKELLRVDGIINSK